MAEWSKALESGIITYLVFRGVGSNPTVVKAVFLFLQNPYLQPDGVDIEVQLFRGPDSFLYDKN
jgi:hypothetical protein